MAGEDRDDITKQKTEAGQRQRRCAANYGANAFGAWHSVPSRRQCVAVNYDQCVAMVNGSIRLKGSASVLNGRGHRAFFSNFSTYVDG